MIAVTTSPSRIFIPEHVPSSKNSRVLTKQGKFVASKAVQTYRKNSAIFWKINAVPFRTLHGDKLIHVAFHFVRKTRHLYDWVNPLQTVLDEMVKYEWIEDDNIDVIIPHPLEIDGRYTTHDPKKPGVFIQVL